MDDDQLADWCNEHLLDLYDEGMFDCEEISDDVWAAVDTIAQETVLEFIDDEDERDDMNDALVSAVRDWFRVYHDTIIESIQTVDTSDMKNKPQVAQHTAEWYAQRRNRLTASEFAQILDGRRGALLRSKINPTPEGHQERGAVAPVAIAQEDGEMVATSWGHRFEPIVRRIYELEIAGLNTVCDTLGRFTHTTIPWLSASPDGVVLSGQLQGRLVEIKAPKTRQPGEFVPHEYFVQMQIQMEVCNLDAVDFLEARFSQRPVGAITEADEEAIRAATWKGRVEVYGYLENSETWTYRYSEPVEDLEDAIHAMPVPLDLPLLESSVWWLPANAWFPRTVLRNRKWWSTVGWPAAELFWAQVESGRSSALVAFASASAAPAPASVSSSWIGSA